MNNNYTTVPPKETFFEEWWLQYPRKIGKSAAKKKYFSVKNVSEKTLMNAVIRFAAQTRVEGIEERFIPHAATWLNQQRWEDQLQPLPPPPPPPPPIHDPNCPDCEGTTHILIVDAAGVARVHFCKRK